MPGPLHPKTVLRAASEPVEDLVRPKPLEPLQGAVEGQEVLRRNAADLMDRPDVALVKMIDDVGDVAALLRQADADRAAVHTRPLMMDIAHLDELLEIVGDIRAEIVAARTE